MVILPGIRTRNLLISADNENKQNKHYKDTITYSTGILCLCIMYHITIANNIALQAGGSCPPAGGYVNRYSVVVLGCRLLDGFED
eukprot:scaffold7441_cov109-Skeletonema_dohrnii-CCMP3373.AAC.8